MRTMEELLALAAEQLEDGRYLDGDFIMRHNLEAEETIGVWERMALIVRDHLSLSPNKRLRSVFRGVMLASGLPQDIVEASEASIAMPSIVEELRQAGRKLAQQQKGTE